MDPLDEALQQIAAGRRRDPLAPVTVIVPSRPAALQLRRRLAQLGSFAGVRFEPVTRIAELMAAADLARDGRRPLARPIADYAARELAFDSRGPLKSVAGLPGYARALRQTFRRLRRGGFRTATEIPNAPLAGQLPEIQRLFGGFREMTSGFYDDQDLLEMASTRLRTEPDRVLPELGDVYVVPPFRASAGEATFLDAVRAAVEPHRVYVEIEAAAGSPEERFVLAPDAASEARVVVREVIGALQRGMRQDEIAVFYSGDRSYRPLLEQAFEAAAVPMAAMPGTPLIELPAGRAVLALARLPLLDYSRVALFDFLSVAPLRRALRTAEREVPMSVRAWQRAAREAGITHGLHRWHDAINVFEQDCLDVIDTDGDVSEARRGVARSSLEAIRDLRTVAEDLFQQLESLRDRMPAGRFIQRFALLVRQYLADDAKGLANVQAEVEQLGTIDAIGGAFDLASFAEALEANLSAACLRTSSFGAGVLVADYRLAAGLRFRQTFLCGAYEGAFPAVMESEPLIQDGVWTSLREQHPHIDDMESRSRRAGQSVAALRAAAGTGVLAWSFPLQAANATRDYYPAVPMLAAVCRRDETIRSGTDLRLASERAWLRRSPSPLAAMLTGPQLDRWEGRLREAIAFRHAGLPLGQSHPLAHRVALLRARRGAGFTEFDGNLAAMEGRTAPAPGSRLSPTSLEHYAACGFRFFLASVLRLHGVEEPEESETMAATEKGTLVHKTLQRFFAEQLARGRPGPGEPWTPADSVHLLSIFEDELAHVRRLGRAGLDVYAEFDRRSLRADLDAFLDHDTEFRLQTGAVPAAFERRVPLSPLDDVALTGYVDRIDRTADGQHAYVIDYKTGSAKPYEKSSEVDPFAGGTLLQLPVYVLATGDVEEVRALYWFISRRGEFAQITYDETPDNRQRFEETVRAILAGQRAGAYPAVPGREDDYYHTYENCRYCEFDRLCSRRRVYENQDKQADPGLIPWRAVSDNSIGRPAQ